MAPSFRHQGREQRRRILGFAARWHCSYGYHRLAAIRREICCRRPTRWVPATGAADPLSVQLALVSLPDTTVNPPPTINIEEIGPFDSAAGWAWRSVLARPAIPRSTHRLAIASEPGHLGRRTRSAGGYQRQQLQQSPNGNISRRQSMRRLFCCPAARCWWSGGNTETRSEQQRWGQFLVATLRTCSFTIRPPTAIDPARRHQPPSNNVDCWQARFLLLPTGQVLMTTGAKPDDRHLDGPGDHWRRRRSSWRPVITGFTPIMAVGHHYKISGTATQRSLPGERIW